MQIDTQQIEATRQRYEQRRDEREENQRKLDAGLILQADSPERVEKRLKRLGLGEVAAVVLANQDVSEVPATLIKTPVQDSVALERLFGKSDLMDISYLERGSQVAKSIGRIRVQNASRRIQGYGTGFMISSRLLLTNNHVLPNRQTASYSQVEFNYQDDLNGQPLLPVIFNLDPDALFITDEHLDYTLVAVQDGGREGTTLSSFGWNRLIEAEGKAIVGEYVSIIQHPGGERKQIALRENQLIDVLPDFLHYHTDTSPGSSGSPVFNDQWEVVALHHSGVPKTDARGRILAIDGSVWTQSQGEHRIAWLANEGVRISQITKHIQQQPLPLSQQALRNNLFEPKVPPIPQSMPTHNSSSGNGSAITPIVNATETSPVVSNDGTITWTIPLQVSVRLGQPIASSVPVTPVAPVVVTPTTPPKDELTAALEEFRAAARKPYYDATRDQSDRDAYYDRLLSRLDKLSPTEFYAELNTLLTRTHNKKLTYKPATHLYPWIDLQPDLTIQSIYSQTQFKPEELIREDFRVDQIRAVRSQELRVQESVLTAEQFQTALDLLEASLPYNCEHVVPQSWFNKKEPMRGDLHHLFACEPNCNSFRGNNPYTDFPSFKPELEVIRDRCGMLDKGRFEPGAGKGAVARATLYFLLRYPGEINQTVKEYKAESLQTLLQWHTEFPPTEYELHRNAAIFEKQGNRNPLIDFPEWADKIAFRSGLG